MLLEAISKIQRQSILTAILFAFLGIVLILCPEKYVSALIMVSGYVMIIYSLEQTLEFLASKSSVMSCIKFVLSLVVGLVGLAVLVFSNKILNVLSWIFGLLLIIDGGQSIYYGFTFARRSGRSGWSILIILSSILIASGLFLIFGVIYFSVSAFKTPEFLMRIIGVAVLFSAIISGLRLLWLWPSKTGGEENAN